MKYLKPGNIIIFSKRIYNDYLKDLELKDFNRENIVNFCKRIYNDYIKPFDYLKLSYFPFIGWYIPMIIRKGDDFYTYHAKQGFVLAAYFALACTFLICFNVFIPEKADIIQFFIVMLIYIHYIVYFTLCVLGTKMIKRGEKGEFPYISQYISMVTSKIDI